MKKFKTLLNQINYILSRPQKILSIAVFLITSLGSLLECLGVSVIIPVIKLILEPEQLAGGIIGRVFPFIIELKYKDQVIIVITAVVVIYIIKNLYFVFMSWLRNKFAFMIQRQLSVAMMRSYMSRGYSFFLNNSYGDITRGIESDTSGVYNVMINSYRLLSDLLTIILICTILLIADWKMTLIVALLSALSVAFIYFFFRKNMYKTGQMLRKYGAECNQALVQSIQGIKDVIILRKQKYFTHKYEYAKIGYQAAALKTALAGECPTYIIEGISISGIMIAVGYNVIRGVNTAAFISTLAALAVGAFRILPYLGKVMGEMNSITVNMPSVAAVYNDFKEAKQYSIEHPEYDYRLIKDSLTIKDKNEELFKNKIEFKSIIFSYDNQPESSAVLRNITLDIHKGQSIAIIGSSGAGKSTLVDVLLGLLVPKNGNIYVDGVDITKNPDLWARMVGYVPQSVFLCDATIKENVAFGEDLAQIDEVRVVEALKKAELNDFVNTLPERENTYVGDRGVRLSGGQRQRIAIARALYHRPEILILDEATSALDNETETAIMSAIDSLHGNVTMVIVAHRLTTIRNCDLIYEIKNGIAVLRDKQDVFAGIK